MNYGLKTMNTIQQRRSVRWNDQISCISIVLDVDAWLWGLLFLLRNLDIEILKVEEEICLYVGSHQQNKFSVVENNLNLFDISTIFEFLLHNAFIA